MSPAEVPPIGERIRGERARRGWTVRGLAREVGVSASLVSQIETGKSQPSVSTLYAITTALRIPIEVLFAAPGDDPPTADALASEPAGQAVAADLATAATGPAATDPLVGSVSAQPPAAGVSVDDADAEAGRGATRALGLDRTRCVGPVVHPDGREVLTLDSGVTWELLGQVPGVHVEFLRVTYPPGSASSTSGQLMRHNGTEYGYLVDGELVLTLGFDEHRLEPGDAFSFSSTTPHGYRNDGTEPAVGIWFVLEGS